MMEGLAILAEMGNIKSGIELMKEAADITANNPFFAQEMDISGGGPAIDELYEIDAAYKSLWEALNLLYANTISYIDTITKNLEDLDENATNNCGTEG